MMKKTIPALVLAALMGCASAAHETRPEARAPRRNVPVEQVTIIVAGAD